MLRSFPGLQVEIPPAPEPDEGAAAEHKRAGDQAFVRKRYEDAVAAYTRSLQHATGNPLVWANRSVAHLRVNSPAEAFQDARRSRTLDPKYFKASWRGAGAHTGQVTRSGPGKLHGIAVSELGRAGHPLYTQR